MTADERGWSQMHEDGKDRGRHRGDGIDHHSMAAGFRLRAESMKSMDTDRPNL